MKITIDADANEATITFEINGNIFKQKWTENSGMLRTHDDDFSEQAAKTGMYNSEELDSIYSVLDFGFLASDFTEMADACEKKR